MRASYNAYTRSSNPPQRFCSLKEEAIPHGEADALRLQAQARGDWDMTARPCRPKKQIYEGEPGTTLVCPECNQPMRGIPYPYGIGLLTLPVHYNPLWVQRSFPMLRAARVLQRRSTSR